MVADAMLGGDGGGGAARSVSGAQRSVRGFLSPFILNEINPLLKG